MELNLVPSYYHLIAQKSSCKMNEITNLLPPYFPHVKRKKGKQASIIIIDLFSFEECDKFNQSINSPSLTTPYFTQQTTFFIKIINPT